MFGNTQTAPVLIAKFGWDVEQAILYNTLISNSSVVGLFMGSLLGGIIISGGRRRAILAVNVLVLIGSSTKLV